MEFATAHIVALKSNLERAKSRIAELEKALEMEQEISQELWSEIDHGDDPEADLSIYRLHKRNSTKW